ncbi:SSPO protein, partial [Herpetotheres cachinnans]|nr:SSPO protein [Herpetotheres cachinnans]
QHQGRRRAPGERWRGGPCHVCQCLPSLAVRCSPYCPHRAAGCPQGQLLVEGRGDSCCFCAPAGESGGAGAMAQGGPRPHGALPGGAAPAPWHGGCPTAGDNGTAVPPVLTTESPGSPPPPTPRG